MPANKTTEEQIRVKVLEILPPGSRVFHAPDAGVRVPDRFYYTSHEERKQITAQVGSPVQRRAEAEQVLVYSTPLGVSAFYDLYVGQCGGERLYYGTPKDPLLWWTKESFPLRRLRGARGRKRALVLRHRAGNKGVFSWRR